MEFTLFGIIETKAEAKHRAGEIAAALADIEGAPEARACIAHQWHQLNYFINRAKAHKLDPNDHDGIMRTVGELGELLTSKECQQMNRNAAIWKSYTEEFSHWPGILPRSRYCVTLHPKEIAYLENLREEVFNDLLNIREAVRDARRKLIALRAVAADLPEDIAKRYNLTPKGERLATNQDHHQHR